MELKSYSNLAQKTKCKKCLSKSLRPIIRNRDPCSKYWSGSTKMLKRDPILIRIHNNESSRWSSRCEKIERPHYLCKDKTFKIETVFMFWRVFWQFVKSFQQPFIICGCGYWVTGEINWAETLVLVSNNFFLGSESWCSFVLIWSDLNHDIRLLSFWSDPIWIMMYKYFLSDLIRSESWCTSTLFLIWLPQ